MCYELVQWCLRLLSGSHVDRFDSKPPPEKSTEKKTRGALDIILTEKEKPRKKKKVSAAPARARAPAPAAGEDSEEEVDSEGEEVVKKVLSTFFNN